MKTKVCKQMVYEGLGFPVILHHVTMVHMHNEWHPKIDVQDVADTTIKELATQPERFTGDQLKFIRSYFLMSLRNFAKEVVNESHTAVNKWEKYGSSVTNMDINIEKIIRLFILEKLLEKKVKGASKREFFDSYKDLATIQIHSKQPSSIEIRG